jgi:hypothetical protein
MRGRDRADKAAVAALRKEMRADKKARRRAREQVRFGGLGLGGWGVGLSGGFGALGVAGQDS